MQRKPDIKWRKSDVEKLKNEVQRFNAKISRAEKRHPELKGALPDKIKPADFMKEIKTRQDFNRELKSLDRFSKRGAEKPITSKTGNTVTQWEKKEVGYKVAQINRERTKERQIVERMPVTSQGKPTGLKRGEMGSERLAALQPKKYDFDKIRGGKEWEKFVDTVKKQSSEQYRQQKMEEYKENYLKGLSNVFGEYADELIGKLKDLDAETLVNKFYSEQEATIDFIYDPIELMARLETIEDIWEGVFEEQEDGDY
jgi:hypothetical protein